MASDWTLEPGARIDRFEIVQILGWGGTAHVYRVRHTTLGSDHALKLLTPPHASLRDRLAQEGRVQAKLRHPNIVAVTDVVEHEGRAGLVMELVQGPTLDQWLREHGAMPPLEAIRLMDGVLAAVAVAHAAEVLHRDLKPANILLEERPQGLVARVTDFGIAKVFSDDARLGQTRAGLTLGTPGYMAPEQWADAAQADAGADVFALGVILYELIAGVRPYDGDSPTAVLEATMAGRHVPLGERVRSIDSVVAAVIERAIRPDPAARFLSVAAFREALRDAAGLGGRAEPTIVLPPLEPILGPGPTGPTLHTRGAPRTVAPLLFALAAPLVLGALALGAMVWWASEATVTITAPLVAKGLEPQRVPVAGGPFYFGAAGVQRLVDVDSFEIDRTEVATVEYLRCVHASACAQPAWGTNGAHEEYEGLTGELQPIVGVSWTQANAYCRWRNGRLPTEGEWERAATWAPAARSAGDKRAWPWGDALPSCALVNFEECHAGTTVDVTELPKGASAYGALNMVGNVWEWTDTELPLAKKKGLGGVFQKAPKSHRVLKGGGYNAAVGDISPTGRFHVGEDTASPLYGFRCAYDVP